MRATILAVICGEGDPILGTLWGWGTLKHFGCLRRNLKNGCVARSEGKEPAPLTGAPSFQYQSGIVEVPSIWGY